MGKHFIFIDESGNAGANLLDERPIFVIVGMAVMKSKVKRLNDRFNQLKQKHHLKPEQELKGTNIIRNRHNVLMKEAASLIISEGLPIFASIVERRYMISVLIVDNFFDPVYNDRLGNEWGFPIQVKKNLGDHFYNHLRDETIKLAGHVFMHGEKSEMETLLSQIEGDLKGNSNLGKFDILDALNGTKGFVDELSQVIQDINQSADQLQYTKGTIKAPNVTCFVDTMMRIEHFYRNKSGIQAELVFDSSRQFDRMFSALYKMHKNAGPATIPVPNHAPLLYGFKSITGFSVSDSSMTPLLQCADYFATGLRSVMELFLMDNQPDTLNDAMSFFLALLCVAGDVPNLINLVISGSLGRKMFAAFAKYAPKK